MVLLYLVTFQSTPDEENDGFEEDEIAEAHHVGLYNLFWDMF